MASPVFTSDVAQAATLNRALEDRALLVVGLCAAWCNTCTEFRRAFDELANERTDAVFLWMDIEDDADLVGDIDVENFPTIAVYHSARLVHLGPSLPQRQVVSRLIASLDGTSRTIEAEIAVVELPGRLARRPTRSPAQDALSTSSDSPSSAETN